MAVAREEGEVLEIDTEEESIRSRKRLRPSADEGRPIVVPPGTVRFLTKAERAALKSTLDAQMASAKPQLSVPAAINRFMKETPKPKEQAPAQKEDPASLLRSQEIEQIREEYLGTKKDRRKVQKPSEKFRNIFQFDWDPSEDTMAGDANPLYTGKHEPHLLFGRGFRAGLDVREQRKKNKFYDSLAKMRKQKLAELEGKGLQGDELMQKLVEEMSVLALMRHDPVQKTEESDEEDEEEDVLTKPLHEMTDRDWRILREDLSISTKGGKIPRPIRNWNESGLPKEIQSAVAAAGYQQPTAIQMQAIPIALQLRDLIGIAETGSGKTAAFMLPMLAYINKLPRLTDDKLAQQGPYGLVLAPSRELAIQIRDETEKFALYLKISAVAVVGGRSAEQQAFQLREGAEVVIGTPGRIKDCLEKAYTVLIQCNYVVLDEADRMIDLGFEEAVNNILDQIPSTGRQNTSRSDFEDDPAPLLTPGYREFRLTHMFSATMPTAVERLARRYLRSPAVISIGIAGAAKKDIMQEVEFLTELRKKQRLIDLLTNSPPRVIVFVNQKKNCDVVVKLLQKAGFLAVALHGGKAQDLREISLEQFKQGVQNILVATDVAGRGIDVEDVTMVVNYDMPATIDAYTHRIGRTGRAGKKGRAVSFITEDDSPIFYDLKQYLAGAEQPIPPDLAQHPAARAKPTPGETQPSTNQRGGRFGP